MSCCWGIGLGTLPAWPLWSHQHKPKYPKNEPHLWVSRTFVLPDVGPLKHLVGPSRVPTTGIIITDVAQSDPKSLGLLANTWCMTWVDTWLVAWLHRRNTAASLRTFGVVVLPIGWNQGSELCLLMGVPLHRMTTEGCNQAASKLAANIMCRMHLWFTLQDDSKVGTKKFKSPFRTSKEMARLGGNAIALRSAAVAIIITMRAVDPALMQRYLEQWPWAHWSARKAIQLCGCKFCCNCCIMLYTNWTIQKVVQHVTGIANGFLMLKAWLLQLGYSALRCKEMVLHAKMKKHIIGLSFDFQITFEAPSTMPEIIT